MKLLLLSGGLDSTTLLAEMVRNGASVRALSINYGQLHKIELECAKWQAACYRVPHTILDITGVFENIRNPLFGQGIIPQKSYKEQYGENGEGKVSTYIPNRNMILLSVAAAHALELGCDTVAYAAHSDDGAHGAYPDCTFEFISKMDIVLQTQGIHLSAPYINMTKVDIAKQARRLEVNIEKTHSCYSGVPGGCGKCATCIDREAALREAFRN